MLSIGKPITDVKAAESYYTQNGKDDYYTKNNIGVWFGAGAQKLGLIGEINPEDYNNIIRGLDKDGNPLGEHTKGERRIGVDFTFSAPKSVSILYEVFGNEDMLVAHKKAVEQALSLLENDFCVTRKTISGITEKEVTNNIVAATFNHHASRELDPQLHTHCVVMNITERSDGQWRAVEYEPAYKARLYLSQTYQNTLANELKKLGYEIDVKQNHTFELKGIPDELIDVFSKRRGQVLKRALELKNQNPNISNKKLFEMAALDSRIAKREIAHEEVFEMWGAIARDFDIEIQKNKNFMEQDISRLAIKAVLDAGRILTENESAFEIKQLYITALKCGLGEVTNADIMHAFSELKGKDFIKLGEIQGRNSGILYTTKEMWEIEQKTVKILASGKGIGRQILEVEAAAKKIKAYSEALDRKTGHAMTGGQIAAAEKILSSKDQFIGVQGDAGTGKTTMLAAVKDICELTDSHIKIRGLAPTGKAAAEIMRNAGIESTTIDYFLGSFQIKNEATSHKKKEVWVVDENSMTDSRKFLQLVELAHDIDAKVIFLGDIKQLQPVGAGKTFEKLQDLKVIDFVTMSDVVRQTNNVAKDVVYSFSNKQVDKTFEHLEKNGKIHEVTENQKSVIVTDFVRSYQEDQGVLLVTTLNETVAELNHKIRAELRNIGVISDKEYVHATRQVATLNSLQKYTANSYNVGQYVFFRKNIDVFKAGQEAKIVEIDTKNNSIILQYKENSSKKLQVKALNLSNTEYAASLSVFSEKNLSIAAGDRIVFLKNDKKIGVQNGLSGNIISISGKQLTVRLESGDLVKFSTNEYGYFNHGYAVTDYKSQGQTASKVILYSPAVGERPEKDVGLESELIEKTLNKTNIYTIKNSFNSFYVGITRGKEDIVVYTDDKSVLKEQVKNIQNKLSTLDSYSALDPEIAFQLQQVLSRIDTVEKEDITKFVASNFEAKKLIDDYKQNPTKYWSEEKKALYCILQSRRDAIKNDLENGFINVKQADSYSVRVDILEKKLLFNTSITKQDLLSLNISYLLQKNTFYNFFEINKVEQSVDGVYLSGHNRNILKDVICASKATLDIDKINKIEYFEKKLERSSKITLAEIQKSGVFSEEQMSKITPLASKITVFEETVNLKANDIKLVDVWLKENMQKPMSYKLRIADRIEQRTKVECDLKTKNNDQKLTQYIKTYANSLTPGQLEFVKKLSNEYGMHTEEVIQNINAKNIKSFIEDLKERPRLRDIEYLKIAGEKRGMDISAEIAGISSRAEYEELYKKITTTITKKQQELLQKIASKHHLDIDFQRINSAEAGAIITTFKDKPTAKQLDFVNQLSRKWQINVDANQLSTKDVAKIKEYTDVLNEIKKENLKNNDYSISSAAFVKLQYEYKELSKDLSESINAENYLLKAKEILLVDKKQTAGLEYDRYLLEAIKCVELAKEHKDVDTAVKILDKISESNKDVLESEFKDMSIIFDISEREVLDKVIENNYSYSEAKTLKEFQDPERFIRDNFDMSDGYSMVNTLDNEKFRAMAQLVVEAFDEHIFSKDSRYSEEMLEYSCRLSEKAETLAEIYKADIEKKLQVATYVHFIENEEFFSAQKILEDISGSDNYSKFEKIELEEKYTRKIEQLSEAMDWKEELREIAEKSRMLEHASEETISKGYDNDFEFER